MHRNCVDNMIPSFSFNKRKQQRDFGSYRILLLFHDINIDKIYNKSESFVFWKDRSTCTFFLFSFRGRNWTAPIFLTLFLFYAGFSNSSFYFFSKTVWHKYKSFYSPSSTCWVDLKLCKKCKKQFNNFSSTIILGCKYEQLYFCFIYFHLLSYYFLYSKF